MKTAMEEMFDHLKAMGFADAPFKKEFLQKEREQIIMSFISGFDKSKTCLLPNNKKGFSEIFYNKKYKNNETNI